METLTLILHKSKETKNKVVYGTKDGSVIQSVYIDKDALGDVRQPPYRSLYPRSDPGDGLFDSLVADESHRVPHATGGRRWRNHHIVEIEAVMLQGHKVVLNLLIRR